jgi:type I restriction enzyme S subunit
VRFPTIQLRHVARLRYGDALPDERRRPGGTPVYASGGEVGRHDEANTTAPVIVVGRKGSYGAVHWDDRPAFVIDTAYAIDRFLRPTEPRWLYYVLQSANLRALSQDVGVPGLSRDTVHALRIPDCPLPIQKRIADFLDRECERISRLSAALQSQGDRVREWEHARRTEAFAAINTRRPLRRTTRVYRGTTFPDRFQGSASGDLPFVKVADFSRGGNETRLVGAANWVTEEVARELRATVVPSGAVVFPRVGMAMMSNPRRLAMRPVIIDDNQLALVLTQRGDPRYLYHWLTTVDLVAEANPGAVPTVTDTALKRLRIPWPSPTEQSRIADRLDADANNVQVLLSTITTWISGLAEYRDAVITEAVAGVLDVRQGGAPNPPVAGELHEGVTA